MKSKVAIKKQSTLRPKEKVVYVDCTDFWYEMGEAAGGSKVYGSIEEVLKYSPCAKECGVVEVTIKYKKQVLPTEHKQGKTISEWEEYQTSSEFIEHLEDGLTKIQALAKRYKSQIKQLRGKKK